MKNLKILLLFSMALLIFSCTKDNDSITSSEDYEVVKRQRSWSDLFTPITVCEASNITFAIHPNCAGTPYATEILNAIQAYNDAPTCIFFTPAANFATANLVFNCVAGNVCGEAVASAPFPTSTGPNVQTTFLSGGTIGGQIDLETGWTNCPCTDSDDCNFTGDEPACMFKRTVMHEIGHALGIAHNDDTSGNWIPGTNDAFDDPYSVFNSGPVTNDNCDWCDAPCAFNANDITALQSIYPEIVVECECPGFFGPCACEEANVISLPTIWEEEGCVPEDHFMTICALGWAGDPQPAVTYSWSSTGTIVLESNTDGRCVDISVGTDGGTVTVTMTSDDCGTNYANTTIEICEDTTTTGTGNGPGPGPKKGRPKDIE